MTDAWDQRCLKTVLTRFFHPKTLDKGYTYCENPAYYAPETTSLEAYKEYIEALPQMDPPEIFDMHTNANITFQKQASMQMVNIILEVQPRVVTGGVGKSSNEIVDEVNSNHNHRIAILNFEF